MQVTRYSVADSDGYIANEDQMDSDLVGFLSTIVSIFPSLKTIIAGESYVGTYIVSSV
jgi:carboxypeptidase D